MGLLGLNVERRTLQTQRVGTVRTFNLDGDTGARGGISLSTRLGLARVLGVHASV